MADQIIAVDRPTGRSQDAINWVSTTDLINDIKKACKSKVPIMFSFKIGKKSPVSDLGEMGKFLSTILFLKHNCKITVQIFIENSQRSNSKYRNLIKYGLLELLSNLKIEFTIVDDKSEILKKHIEQIQDDRIGTALSASVGYNCVVVPLDCHSFKCPLNPNSSEHLEWVEQTTDEVIAKILVRTNAFIDNCIDIKPEIAKAVLPVIRELVSNSVQHSPCHMESENTSDNNSDIAHQIIYAVTYSRENNPKYGRAGRVSTLEGWEDKFDVLVLDFGQGMQSSVRQKFAHNIGNAENYSITRLWGEGVLFEDLYKEQQLLSTVFRGNLVVRKGRKSLGLQSISSMCMTQNACLNFHSGSTEVLVGEHGGSLHVINRVKELSYWLPGVIVSVYIPIHGMKLTRARTRLANIRRKDRESLFPCQEPAKPISQTELAVDPELPKGLFGGLSRIKTTRRSETDAIRLRMAEKFGQCQVIDLKASGAVDTDFLDSLIQELCKSWESASGEVERSANCNHPFSNRIFINAPRPVVTALKERNCNSFLIENRMICLITDEHDQPHFMGIKRATTNANDLEDLLMMIYMSGNIGISEDDLRRIGFTDQVLDIVRPLFPIQTESSLDSCFVLYYRLKKGTSSYYVWRNANLTLWRMDADCTKNIKDFTLKLDHGYSQLRNGILIDRTYDFPRFWSDDHRLRGCAKRLSQRARFPLVKQIISFKGNGDVLAGAIRDVIGAPELLLLDIDHIQDDFHLIGTNAVLVVDMLLPGDGRLDSYVGCTINKIREKLIGDELFILTFANMAQEIRDGLNSCKIVSLKAMRKDLPIICNSVDPGTAIYGAGQIHENFSTPGTKCDFEKRQNLRGQWSPKFSPLELSSEFWHNVAELKIITGEKQRGDSRQLLYFEDNEAVIRHPRLREQLNEFVENYVRNILELRLEVIIHPNHSTGAYLAHLVAKNLTINPLILPLTQPKYGGPIQLSSNEFRHLQNQIENFRDKHMGRQPRCLVVDDSILTGGSIFTMLGLASQLDIKPVGILVLINRLKPEVSQALSLFSSSFAYFLRFHIPKLEDQDEPNARLAKLDSRLDEQLLNSTSSYFACYWSMNHIRQNGDNAIRNHLQRDIEFIDASPPKIDDPESFSLDDNTALQIIHRLLLHPDTRTIDFTTRIAIVFNYLDRLLDADREFKFLVRLHEQGKTEYQYSQTNQLLRKILFLLAFSRPVLSSKDNKMLTDRCGEFVDYYMSDSHWQSYVTVLCETMMCLGALSATSLLNFLIKSVEGGIVQTALDAFDVPEDALDDPKRAARDVCGSMAWATAILLNSKKISLDRGSFTFSENFLEKITQLLSNTLVSMEQRFFLIETLFPVIVHDKNLQDTFGVTVTDENEETLEIIKEKVARKYLTDAPGYTVTLRTALHLFAADSVFLIAWADAKDKIQLKGFETRNHKRSPNHEINSRIPEPIRQRMLNRLYFDDQSPEWLNELIEMSPIDGLFTKCFGAAVESQDGLNYYILAAYTDANPSLPTAFYYWLKYKPELKSILHLIHVKYVQSSVTWDLLRTSHKVFHPPRKGTIRRDALRVALQETPVGRLLNEVVSLYSHRPKSVLAVYRIICEVNDQLEKNARGDTTGSLKYKGCWPISCMPPKVPIGKMEAYIAFPVPVLKFILLECLCNALSFLKTRGTIRFEYLYDDEHPKIFVKVTNDISQPSLEEHNEAMKGSDGGTGVLACYKAAVAANGVFTYPDPKDVEETYTTTISLPVHAMPEKLWRFMK